MTRGLPVSLLIHALTLGLVLIFGNSVNQKQFVVPRTIGVQLVELPKVQQPKVVEQEPVKVVEPPKQQPKVQEELPPKEVPEKKPDPKPEIKPDKPKEIIPKDDPPLEVKDDPAQALPNDNQTPDTPVAAMPSGASVAGIDTNFPYAWYITLMEGQVARNWNPKQMGFRNTSIYCVIHFTIQRSGAVNQLTLTRSSGIGVFDRDAMRAIKSIQLGPLPGDFGSNTVGISMTFNLESDDR